MNKKIKLLAIALVAVIVTVGVAFAANQLVSNSIAIQPVPTPTPTPQPQATLSIQANTTAPFIGGAVNVTAHVSDNLAGIPILFYINNTYVETGVTGTGGYANVTLTFPTLDLYIVNATAMHP